MDGPRLKHVRAVSAEHQLGFVSVPSMALLTWGRFNLQFNPRTSKRRECSKLDKKLAKREVCHRCHLIHAMH